MAISVVQQPTYPNVTNTHLLYTVTSNLSGNPQYQYVMDVKQSGSLLTRVKQYPNPNAAGIFDPARILNDYIEFDENWKTSTLLTPVTSVQQFDILFGEEYGTSLSSSVVLYDGNGNPGDPAVTTIQADVFGGVVDPNNGVSFNWQAQPILSNTPLTGQKIAYNDYHTLAFYNNGTVTSVSVDYDPGPTVTYSLQSGFNTVPVGSKNIAGASTWDTITVTAGSTDIIYTLDEECNYDRVRFAFINKYGFWDYYGINLPVRHETSLMRKSLTRPNVNYDGTIGTYNVQRRGKDYYNTQYEDNYTITTEFVDQETASWLSELIESPSVFVQEGTNFVPIVVTNGSYINNTNKRSQKTFQFEINYQYANARPGR